jgi:hypothetical protein
MIGGVTSQSKGSAAPWMYRRARGSGNLARWLWAWSRSRAVLAERGVLLESARCPIPNVAELIAGEPISGSWWAHPASHTLFAAINAVADSPDVVRLRLANGKVTLVHRRVWPSVVA